MKPNPMKKCLLLLGALCLLATSGCQHALAPTGVYQGDAALYQSELAITTSYEVIHTFVTWEHDNRAALAKWPEIKRAADTMRAGAKQWVTSAHALHDAYRTDPSAPNKAALTKALDLLRTALTQAAGYMAQAAK